MELDEIINDLYNIQVEQGEQVTPEELGEGAAQVLWDRGLISESELDLAVHQSTERARYLLA